jgi:hypothetical protein
MGQGSCYKIEQSRLSRKDTSTRMQHKRLCRHHLPVDPELLSIHQRVGHPSKQRRCISGPHQVLDNFFVPTSLLCLPQNLNNASVSLGPPCSLLFGGSIRSFLRIYILQEYSVTRRKFSKRSHGSIWCCLGCWNLVVSSI